MRMHYSYSPYKGGSSMNIVVLVKQVPAVSEIEIAQDNNLVRVGAPSLSKTQ